MDPQLEESLSPEKIAVKNEDSRESSHIETQDEKLQNITDVQEETQKEKQQSDYSFGSLRLSLPANTSSETLQEVSKGISEFTDISFQFSLGETTLNCQSQKNSITSNPCEETLIKTIGCESKSSENSLRFSLGIEDNTLLRTRDSFPDESHINENNSEEEKIISEIKEGEENGGKCHQLPQEMLTTLSTMPDEDLKISDNPVEMQGNEMAVTITEEMSASLNPNQLKIKNVESGETSRQLAQGVESDTLNAEVKNDLNNSSNETQTNEAANGFDCAEIGFQALIEKDRANHCAKEEFNLVSENGLVESTIDNNLQLSEVVGLDQSRANLATSETKPEDVLEPQPSDILDLDQSMGDLTIGETKAEDILEPQQIEVFDLDQSMVDLTIGETKSDGVVLEPQRIEVFDLDQSMGDLTIGETKTEDVLEPQRLEVLELEQSMGTIGETKSEVVLEGDSTGRSPLKNDLIVTEQEVQTSNANSELPVDSLEHSKSTSDFMKEVKIQELNESLHNSVTAENKDELPKDASNLTGVSVDDSLHLSLLEANTSSKSIHLLEDNDIQLHEPLCKKLKLDDLETFEDVDNLESEYNQESMDCSMRVYCEETDEKVDMNESPKLKIEESNEKLVEPPAEEKLNKSGKLSVDGSSDSSFRQNNHEKCALLPQNINEQHTLIKSDTNGSNVYSPTQKSKFNDSNSQDLYQNKENLPPRETEAITNKELMDESLHHSILELSKNEHKNIEHSTEIIKSENADISLNLSILEKSTNKSFNHEVLESIMNKSMINQQSTEKDYKILEESSLCYSVLEDIKNESMKVGQSPEKTLEPEYSVETPLKAGKAETSMDGFIKDKHLAENKSELLEDSSFHYSLLESDKGFVDTKKAGELNVLPKALEEIDRSVLETSLAESMKVQQLAEKSELLDDSSLHYSLLERNKDVSMDAKKADELYVSQNILEETSFNSPVLEINESMKVEQLEEKSEQLDESSLHHSASETNNEDFEETEMVAELNTLQQEMSFNYPALEINESMKVQDLSKEKLEIFEPSIIGNEDTLENPLLERTNVASLDVQQLAESNSKPLEDISLPNSIEEKANNGHMEVQQLTEKKSEHFPFEESSLHYSTLESAASSTKENSKLLDGSSLHCSVLERTKNESVNIEPVTDSEKIILDFSIVDRTKKEPVEVHHLTTKNIELLFDESTLTEVEKLIEFQEQGVKDEMSLDLSVIDKTKSEPMDIQQTTEINSEVFNESSLHYSVLENMKNKPTNIDSQDQNLEETPLDLSTMDKAKIENMENIKSDRQLLDESSLHYSMIEQSGEKKIEKKLLDESLHCSVFERSQNETNAELLTESVPEKIEDTTLDFSIISMTKNEAIMYDYQPSSTKKSIHSTLDESSLHYTVLERTKNESITELLAELNEGQNIEETTLDLSVVDRTKHEPTDIQQTEKKSETLDDSLHYSVLESTKNESMIIDHSNEFEKLNQSFELNLEKSGVKKKKKVTSTPVKDYKLHKSKEEQNNQLKSRNVLGINITEMEPLFEVSNESNSANPAERCTTDSKPLTPSSEKSTCVMETPAAKLKDKLKKTEELKKHLEQELLELAEFTTYELQCMKSEKMVMSEIEILQLKMNTLNDNYERVVNENNKIKKECQYYKNKYTDEEVKRELNENRWIKREAELKKSLDEAWNSLSIMKTANSSEMKNRDDEVVNTNRTIHSLESENEALRKMNKSFEEQIMKKDVDLKQLSDSLFSSNNLVSSKDLEIEKLRQEISYYTQQKQELITKDVTIKELSDSTLSLKLLVDAKEQEIDSLKKEILEVKEKATISYDDIETLKENFQIQLKNKDDILTEINNSLSSANNEIQKLRNDIDCLNSDYTEQLKQKEAVFRELSTNKNFEIELLKKEIDAYNVHKVDNSQDLDRKDNVIKQLTDSVTDLTEKLDCKNLEIQELLNNLDCHKELIVIAEKDLSTLKKDYELRLDENSATIKEMSEILKQKDADLEETVNTNRLEIQELQTSLEHHKEMLLNQEKELSTLKEDYELRLDENNVALKEMTEILKQKNTDIEETVNTKNLEIQELQTSLEHHREMLLNQEKELSTLKEDYELRLDENNVALKEMSEILKQKDADFEETVNTKNLEIQKLQTSLEHYKEMLLNQEKELSTLKEDSELRLDEKNLSLNEITETLKQKDIEIEELQKVISNYNSLDEMYKEQLNKKDVVCKDMTESISSLTSEIENKELKIEELSNEILKLNEIYNAKVAEELNNKHESLKVLSDSKKLLEEKNLDIEYLQQQVSAFKEQLLLSEKNNAELQDNFIGQLNKKDELLNDLSESVASAEKLVENKTMEIIELQKEISVLKEDHLNRLNEKEKDLNNMKSLISSLSNQVENKGLEIEDLKEMITVLKEQLAQNDKNLETLKLKFAQMSESKDNTIEELLSKLDSQNCLKCSTFRHPNIPNISPQKNNWNNLTLCLSVSESPLNSNFQSVGNKTLRCGLLEESMQMPNPVHDSTALDPFKSVVMNNSFSESTNKDNGTDSNDSNYSTPLASRMNDEEYGMSSVVDTNPIKKALFYQLTDDTNLIQYIKKIQLVLQQIEKNGPNVNQSSADMHEFVKDICDTYLIDEVNSYKEQLETSLAKLEQLMELESNCQKMYLTFNENGFEIDSKSIADTVKNLINENHSLKQHLEIEKNLQNQYVEISKKCTEVEQELATFKEREARLLADKASLDHCIRLISKLKDIVCPDSMQSNIFEANEALDHFETVITDIAEIKQALKENSVENLSSLMKEHNEKYAELKGSFSQLEERYQNSQAQVNQLKTVVESLKEIKKISKQVSMSTTDLKDWTVQKLEESNIALASFKDLLKNKMDIQNEYNMTVSSYESLKKSLEALESELTVTKMENNMIKSTLKEIVHNEESIDVQLNLIKCNIDEHNFGMKAALSILNHDIPNMKPSAAWDFITNKIQSLQEQLLTKFSSDDLYNRVKQLENDLKDAESFKRNFANELHGLQQDSTSVFDLMKLPLMELHRKMLMTIMEKEQHLIDDIKRQYEETISLGSEKINQLEEEEKRRSAWLNELEKDNDKLNSECTKIKDENANLKVQIQNKIETIQKMQKDHQEEINKINNRYLFDETIEVNREKNPNCFCQQSPALQERFNDLTFKIEEKTIACEKYKKLAKELENKITAMTEELTTKDSEIKSFNHRIELANETCNKLNIQYQEVVDENKAAVIEITDLKNKLKNQIEKYSVLEGIKKDLVEKDNTITDLLEKVSSLEKKLESEKQDLIAEIESMKSQVNKSSENNCSEQVKVLEKTIYDLDSRLVKQNKMLEESESAYTNLESKYKHDTSLLHKFIEDLEVKHNKVEGLLSDIKTQLERKETEIHDIFVKIKMLVDCNSIDEAISKIKTKFSLCKELSDQLEEEKETNKQLYHENEILNSNNKHIKKQLNEKVNELDHKNKKCLEDNNSLFEKVTLLESKNHSLEQKTAEKTSEYENVRQKLEKIIKLVEVNTFEEALTSIQTKISFCNDLKEKLADEKEANKQMDNENEILYTDIKHLEKELRDKMIELEGNNAKFLESNKEMLEKLKELENKNHSLELKITEKTAEYETIRKKLDNTCENVIRIVDGNTFEEALVNIKTKIILCNELKEQLEEEKERSKQLDNENEILYTDIKHLEKNLKEKLIELHEVEQKLNVNTVHTEKINELNRKIKEYEEKVVSLENIVAAKKLRIESIEMKFQAEANEQLNLRKEIRILEGKLKRNEEKLKAFGREQEKLNSDHKFLEEENIKYEQRISKAVADYKAITLELKEERDKFEKENERRKHLEDELNKYKTGFANERKACQNTIEKLEEEKKTLHNKLGELESNEKKRPLKELQQNDNLSEELKKEIQKIKTDLMIKTTHSTSLEAEVEKIKASLHQKNSLIQSYKTRISEYMSKNKILQSKVEEFEKRPPTPVMPDSYKSLSELESRVKEREKQIEKLEGERTILKKLASRRLAKATEYEAILKKLGYTPGQQEASMSNSLPGCHSSSSSISSRHFYVNFDDLLKPRNK
ncbi:golgin subfamily B member 1-like isoform X2 [Cimex lectularius]|uniref:Uncharacterized protein n=1 Tax=Cimex lectularius TaxID=79782 RepID=A0A8I6S0E8_CIMLE|nr:golgin subfamily B member 1-like isoform X2 [Cimex lectularius]